ncbi:MocR-like pyridoxine biosynthesis transcription factor PdxR [Alkalihalobacillus sp. CinArs1]|uniref:MocR-like pyridoxine biosynthesis transcription factor PdxR n=1 Tax=Alkalihalobacillus sp. CinArs1 TaxID=2995314 RepID=UPI0022DDF7FA|nr:PLP-dependent aminotransferase family protein [Alkalihalobacillus sp. CinArs1]
MNEFMIQLDRDRSIPLYLQLYDEVKKQILKGTLPKDSKMPSVRLLSSNLAISRNTVETAYERLLSEGYIYSKARSGYFIQDLATDVMREIAKENPTRNSEIENHPSSITYDFRGNRVDTTNFPLSTWRKITNQSMKDQVDELFHFGHPQGEIGLRKEIAHYLQQARGVTCSEEQIIIGPHSQYLLNLLCQMIGLNGQTIAFENPGYYAAREVFRLLGYKIDSIPVDKNGIDLNHLHKSSAVMAYVTPSHQIPLGYIMPVQQRLKLIEWAVEGNRYIIEDDLNSEFRYSGDPIPALQHLDHHGRIIYMGTFFKSLLPSIRLNYMVLPPGLLEIYQKELIIYQQTTSRVLQKTVEIFMKEGYWIRHLRRMRKIYKKKFEWTKKCIQRYMGDHVTILGDHAGHHVVIKLNEPDKDIDYHSLASDSGIALDSVELFLDKTHPANFHHIYMLCFTALSEEQIEEGIESLRNVWFHN